jgi:hypothetical protein
MGILSYFGKQTYTFICSISFWLFVDHDSELWFRLDYKYMDIHENSYQGFVKILLIYHVFVIDQVVN